MNQKLIKSIIIFQSILIVVVFIAVVYGIYNKLKVNNQISVNTDYSLNLSSEEKILDLQVIDDKYVLITIYDEENNRRFGIIYDIYGDQIIKRIKP